jgi:hypothetical protein
MKAVATAHHNRSLIDFEAALATYKRGIFLMNNARID